MKEKWRLGRVPDAVNDAPEFADRITLALAGGVGCLSLVMARACVVFRGRRQSGTPYP
jgi:hypothetical protein